MDLSAAIQNLKNAMKDRGVAPESGLGTELFLFSSILAPVVNVDLLIFDPDGRVLLSWREDPYSGTGWHIPGTCIRFQETLEESLRRCTNDEIGAAVCVEPGPIKVYEFHINTPRDGISDQRERAHFISLVYRGLLPDAGVIGKQSLKEREPGYLQWFSGLPDDLLPLQECYRRDWEELRPTGG